MVTTPEQMLWQPPPVRPLLSSMSLSTTSASTRPGPQKFLSSSNCEQHCSNSLCILDTVSPDQPQTKPVKPSASPERRERTPLPAELLLDSGESTAEMVSSVQSHLGSKDTLQPADIPVTAKPTRPCNSVELKCMPDFSLLKSHIDNGSETAGREADMEHIAVNMATCRGHRLPS